MSSWSAGSVRATSHAASNSARPTPVPMCSGITSGRPRVRATARAWEKLAKDSTIARLIHTSVTQGDADPDHPVSKEVRAEVTDLVTRFPAYPRG